MSVYNVYHSLTKYIDQLKEKNLPYCAHYFKGFQMWDGAKGLRKEYHYHK